MKPIPFFGGCVAVLIAIAPIPYRSFALLRIGASIVSLGCFIKGKEQSSRAIAWQRLANQQAQVDRKEQKRFAEATRPVVLAEAITKEETRSKAAIEDYNLDAQKALATLQATKHPEWVRDQIAKANASAEEAVAENIQALESEAKSKVEALEASEAESKAEYKFPFGVELPIAPESDLGVKFFDWSEFDQYPENYSHIRAVAPTNGGKTTLIDWLMDVFDVGAEGQKFVVTIKRKPHQWQYLDVIGVPENYSDIRSAMLRIRDERVRRTALMEQGVDYPCWNIAFDEWKAIAKNIKAVVDPKSKEIISQSARDLMGEYITLCRELKIRIFALAQGQQVVTWGLEGESDLAECFCSIYMGKFAIDRCEAQRNRHPKDSDEYAKYQKVRDYLETLGKRAGWVSSEIGEFPAIIPDLTDWKRCIDGEANTAITVGSMADTPLRYVNKPIKVKEIKPEVEPQKQPEPDAEELLEFAKQRLLDAWNADFMLESDTSDRLSTSESNFTNDRSASSNSEVTPEVVEVNDSETSSLSTSLTSPLPKADLDKALARVLDLLGKQKPLAGEVEASQVDECVANTIALISTNPEKALWLGLGGLGFGVTKTSKLVFHCGDSGKSFLKAKGWYDRLQDKFGKICE